MAGLRVLDAGCGEGYNTRLLAQSGATVTGVDISTEMVARARDAESREPLGIGYEIAAFEDLSVFEADSFDVVVSFMALMDGPDLPTAVAELHRVLRPGGRLVFSILHPCFITPASAGSQRSAATTSRWRSATTSPTSRSSSSGRSPRPPVLATAYHG